MPPKQQPVFMIFGVPGSGKTWVAKQMARKALYIPHDLHQDDQFEAIMAALPGADRPIITESPFMEKVLRARLRDAGVEVKPFLVHEDALTVKRRYEAREGRPIPRMHLTRNRNIKARADEWGCPCGTSEEILSAVNLKIPELRENQEPSPPLPPTREERDGIPMPKPRAKKAEPATRDSEFEPTPMSQVLRTRFF